MLSSAAKEANVWLVGGRFHAVATVAPVKFSSKAPSRKETQTTKNYTIHPRYIHRPVGVVVQSILMDVHFTGHDRCASSDAPEGPPLRY